tara:strand:+ start:395 stop:736 length:342 start_codon:yes stop_codon:yes gene_type:complete
MYNQFVKNMDWFLELNKGSNGKNYRYEMVKRLEPLKDINCFKALRYQDSEYYNELLNLIWSIGDNIDRYPSFKSLSWELWGYGFDGEKHISNSKDIEEQLKIIDLLLSTQYWH